MVISCGGTLTVQADAVCGVSQDHSLKDPRSFSLGYLLESLLPLHSWVFVLLRLGCTQFIGSTQVLKVSLYIPGWILTYNLTIVIVFTQTWQSGSAIHFLWEWPQWESYGVSAHPLSFSLSKLGQEYSTSSQTPTELLLRAWQKPNQVHVVLEDCSCSYFAILSEMHRNLSGGRNEQACRKIVLFLRVFSNINDSMILWFYITQEFKFFIQNWSSSSDIQSWPRLHFSLIYLS